METDEVCDRPLETFGALLHSWFFIVALIVCVPFVPQATTKIKLHGSVRAEGVKGWTKKQEKKKKKGEPYDSVMEVKPLDVQLSVSSQFDPDQNVI